MKNEPCIVLVIAAKAVIYLWALTCIAALAMILDEMMKRTAGLWRKGDKTLAIGYAWAIVCLSVLVLKGVFACKGLF